jgi:hypothetical protein
MLFKQKQENGTFTFFESDLNFDVDVATRATKDEEIKYNLEKVKSQKINELNEFHASPEVKQLTIKAGTLEAHIGLDSDSRYLLDEQINLLKFRTDLKEVNPTWTYQNGVSVPLNLSQLIGLRLYIGSLTDYNYKARREAEKTINVLKTLDEIKNFDFKKNYKINQIIPLSL